MSNSIPAAELALMFAKLHEATTYARAVIPEQAFMNPEGVRRLHAVTAPRTDERLSITQHPTESEK